MSRPRISVVIPVGPNPANVRWLQEAVDSVRAQTVPANEILIIDDQAHLAAGSLGPGVTFWQTPWLSGVAHAFNFGVALASAPLVLMLGSDDWLAPECISQVLRSYEETAEEYRDLTYYGLGMWVHHADGTTEETAFFCNAGVTSKLLWEKTGGFPVFSAAGYPDAAFFEVLAIAEKAAQCSRHLVGGGVPLYHYRMHDEIETQRVRQIEADEEDVDIIAMARILGVREGRRRFG